MNALHLTGRLLGKTEIKKTKKDKEYAVLTIEVVRTYDKDFKDIVPVSTFNEKVIEFAKSLREGDLLAIDGSINSFENKSKEGTTFYNISVTANTVGFA